MLIKALMAHFAIASLAVGAGAITPATANYDRCYENPSATGCPGDYNVTHVSFYMAPHIYNGTWHELSRAARHNG